MFRHTNQPGNVWDPSSLLAPLFFFTRAALVIAATAVTAVVPVAAATAEHAPTLPSHAMPVSDDEPFPAHYMSAPITRLAHVLFMVVDLRHMMGPATFQRRLPLYAPPMKADWYSRYDAYREYDAEG